MATVCKSIADQIVQGLFAEDNARRIVRYRNAWGGESYGVTFEGEDPDTYLRESEFIREPKIYWEWKPRRRD